MRMLTVISDLQSESGSSLPGAMNSLMNSYCFSVSSTHHVQTITVAEV